MAYVVLETKGDLGSGRVLRRMPVASVVHVADAGPQACIVHLIDGNKVEAIGHGSIVAEKLWGREE